MLTSAGRAWLAGRATGEDTRSIAQVGIGSDGTVPTATDSALVSEIARASAVASADGDVVTVTASFDLAQAYTVREVGVFLDDGTLIGRWVLADTLIGAAEPLDVTVEFRVSDGGVY